MPPRTHDNGPSITPCTPKPPHQLCPRSSSANALYQPPIAPLRTFLINDANIRNQLNYRRITANLFSNRTFFAHFGPSCTPTPRNLLPASPKLLASTANNDSPRAPMLLSLRGTIAQRSR